ncbi:MAG: MASE2 domain-containing protein [Casimicrobiaceae bacterium]
MKPSLMTTRVHPIVRFNYLIRLIGIPMGAGIVASVRFGEPTSAMVWAALLVYAFGWPHAAHWLGRRSDNPKRTEQYCLMFDCACVGTAASLVSFRLVPTVLLATGILTAVASFGGVPMLAAGLAVLGVTFLLGIVIIDWNTATQAALITVALSLALAFLFQMLLALQTFRQAKALGQNRREIESQAEEILRQNEALAEAMHKRKTIVAPSKRRLSPSRASSPT